MKIQEFEKSVKSGWAVLPVLLIAIVGLVSTFVWYMQAYAHTLPKWQVALTVIGALLVFVTWLVFMAGFFTLQPNVSAVLILFGEYSGTVKASGFHWANPLLTKKKVSLRVNNFNSDTLKVNDLQGNPIEVAVIVVWSISNTVQAVFDVEHYESFVTVQSEAALRHLVMGYPYDNYESDTLSLRSGVDEISVHLQKEVQERVSKAGVIVEEARISHLAYAPEIAGAMLQRQQAEAVVAARSRIVDGAVGMVEMALKKLDENKTVELDEERKAAMVSNLLVVLCGDKSAQPIVNAGTLYN